MADAERVRLIRILLESWHDYLPSQYRVSVQSLSGPASSRLVPCSVCARFGYVLTRRGKRRCLVCEGQGWRKRRPGEPAWDEYTGEQVKEQGDQKLRVMSTHELEATLTRIERLFAERDGRIAAEDELPWLRKARQMAQLGSYRELAAALQQLLASFPAQARAVWHVYVLQSDLPLHDRDRLLRNALANLSMLIKAKKIRVPPWYLPDPQAHRHSLQYGRSQGHSRQRGQRNQEIRERAENGASTTQLAREFNLARRTIQHILQSVRSA